MAKRCLLVAALAALIAGGAFAESIFSAGGGLMFDGGRIGGVSGYGQSYDIDAFGFGAWVFADARFAELAIGFIGGPASMEGGAGFYPISERGSFFAMDLSLLGKFPFAIGAGNISLFPLLGIGYTVMLTVGGDFDLGDSSATDLSTFRIQFGGGADFDISESIFIRTSLLGAWRFPSRFTRDVASDLNTYFGSTGVSANGGFGVAVKVGVGFRF